VIIWRRGEDTAQGVTTVRSVIGSEQQAFFTDQRVVDAFARNGVKAEVDTAGSRQLSTSGSTRSRRRPHRVAERFSSAEADPAGRSHTVSAGPGHLIFVAVIGF
jgi:hypothetical protein